jgi:hypothetical protein
MDCDEDPRRRRPRKFLATQKSTGGVRLDDDRIGQTGFRARPNHQNWTVGWLRRENCSRDSEN